MVLWRDRHPQTREDSLLELTHVIVEAKNFHDRMSADWRAVKADSVVSVPVGDFRITEADAVILLRGKRLKN
jgi:hypothetical protein